MRTARIASTLDNLTPHDEPSQWEQLGHAYGLPLGDNQSGYQSRDMAWRMAALGTAVCGCGWDVGLAVPVLTVGHRGETQDGVGLLFASDNQPGYQSRDMEWRMTAAV